MDIIARRVTVKRIKGVAYRYEDVTYIDQQGRRRKTSRSMGRMAEQLELPALGERKPFTPGEAVDIERERAREREQNLAGRPKKGENFTPISDGTKSLDRVAAAVGLSRPTLMRAMKVVEAAEEEPENYHSPDTMAARLAIPPTRQIGPKLNGANPCKNCTRSLRAARWCNVCVSLWR